MRWIVLYSKADPRLILIKGIKIRRFIIVEPSTTCPSTNTQMLHVKPVRSKEVQDQAGRIIIFISGYIKTLKWRESQWLLLYRVFLPTLHLLNGFAINTKDNSSLIRRELPCHCFSLLTCRAKYVLSNGLMCLSLLPN